MKTKRNYFELTVICVIGVIAVVAAGLYYRHVQATAAEMDDRDSIRISDVHQIRFALDQYQDENGVYPTCLYKDQGCRTTLEGSDVMPEVPKDPLTEVGYSYAANGKGSVCSGFHLGTSLENKHSPFMVLGSDAPVRPICDGSLPDFSGLSFASGGQPCNSEVGVAQPTNDPHGESCHDLTR